MRQLLLLRHAKSSWDDAKLADRDRPLNERGERAVHIMRRAMRKLGLAPDLILVSPARRTLQTLEALEPWDETPLIEQSDLLYLATQQQLLTVLRDIPETVRSVLLIGHNPGMHELAQVLMAAMAPTEATQRLAAAYPTGALAEFTIPGPWLRIGSGAGRLIRFLTPRELERAG